MTYLCAPGVDLTPDISTISTSSCILVNVTAAGSSQVQVNEAAWPSGSTPV
ncbi:unknown [Bacteroides sp. CAG:709]|nr:unknown [Bacteroides sp. CAG:709]